MNANSIKDPPLRRWQRLRLEALRDTVFAPSRYEGCVSLLIYSFPAEGTEEESFRWIECAIRHTWSVLGELHTVLVVHRPFPAAVSFARAHPAVELQVEKTIVPGKIATMSYDCITRLYCRFHTPQVLVIQDDGFPLRDTLDRFLDKWDYIGAPIVSDGWKRKIAYTLRFAAYNGGFSLRTRDYCEYAAKKWGAFWRHLLRENHPFYAEDVFYSTALRILPPTNFRYRFAPERTAFDFSVDTLNGAVKPPQGLHPFGFHGKHTADYLFQNIPTAIPDPTVTMPDRMKG